MPVLSVVVPFAELMVPSVTPKLAPPEAIDRYRKANEDEKYILVTLALESRSLAIPRYLALAVHHGILNVLMGESVRILLTESRQSQSWKLRLNPTNIGVCGFYLLVQILLLRP